MLKATAEEHYDLLVQEGNDPANDPPALQAYMENWDGQPLIDALALAAESRVLEIGVGTGRLAKKVLSAGCGRFTGIDISAASIAQAGINLGGWENVSLIHGDFISADFQQPFDVIYSSLTIFHFKDKRAFIQKAAKLLDAGRFVLSVPKGEERSIQFGSREVELFPERLEPIKSLLAEAGFILLHTVEAAYAHILVAEKA